MAAAWDARRGPCLEPCWRAHVHIEGRLCIGSQCSLHYQMRRSFSKRSPFYNRKSDQNYRNSIDFSEPIHLLLFIEVSARWWTPKNGPNLTMLISKFMILHLLSKSGRRSAIFKTRKINGHPNIGKTRKRRMQTFTRMARSPKRSILLWVVEIFF